MNEWIVLKTLMMRLHHFPKFLTPSMRYAQFELHIIIHSYIHPLSLILRYITRRCENRYFVDWMEHGSVAGRLETKEMLNKNKTNDLLASKICGSFSLCMISYISIAPTRLLGWLCDYDYQNSRKIRFGRLAGRFYIHNAREYWARRTVYTFLILNLYIYSVILYVHH